MLAVSAMAAEALFPKPLHLVRKIEDPVAGTTVTVHEYCAGNRIATVHGDRVAIVDYDAQRIVEIDRRAATFSVTRFGEAASAQPRSLSTAKTNEPRLQIAVDPKVELSRDAVEALIGAAYPHERLPEHEAILQAARGGPRERVATESTSSYALPASVVTTYTFDGESLVIKNTVVSITHELAPPELLAIPAGARQVESRVTRAARELRAPDSTPR